MINQNLQTKCDLFAENYQTIRKNFKWDYAMMHRLSALLYTNAGLMVNVEILKNAKETIKRNTGLFSSFKETTFFALSTLISLESNSEELFQQTIEVYDDMKKAGFHSSPYLTLAAFSIAKQTEAFTVVEVINRAKEFYDAMKKEHWFLTSSDDYGYAAMLASTDRCVPQAIQEMETCFELLKKDFGNSNAVQSLTHVLTIGEEQAEIKCQKVEQIYKSLAEKGCKFNKYNELATLGILALITEDIEKLTDEIVDAYQILLEKKGLGSWSITKHERTMFAATLVADEYIKEMKKNPLSMTLANSITNIVIAQQTAMIIAASSASVAAASSSS